MESLPTDLAKKGVETLIEKAIAELRYLCCYTCIAEDFEKEKKKLVAERKSLEQRIEVAKGRGEVIQANSYFWEDQADEIIKGDNKIEQTCFPNCIRRYRKGRELSSKMEEIKKLLDW